MLKVKGKWKHSTETKATMSKARRGCFITLETRKKISKALKGRSAWNKGLPCSPIVKEKIRKTFKTLNIHWHHTSETKEKLSQIRRSGDWHGPMSDEAKKKIGDANRGRVKSPEARKRMSEAHIGQTAWNKGIPRSERTKAKIRETLAGRYKNSFPDFAKRIIRTKAERYGNDLMPFKDTVPEQLVEAYLKKIGVKYIPQKYIEGCLVDFYLPDLKTIVEVDGCYWHACEKCHPKLDSWKYKKYDDVINCHWKDALKDNKWLDRGYKVIRIWEHEINRNDFSKIEKSFTRR